MEWLTITIVVPLSLQLTHAVEALELEGEVADGEHLVDEEHLGSDVDRDREAEPHEHARRVELHRRVDELRRARRTSTMSSKRSSTSACVRPSSMPLT